MPTHLSLPQHPADLTASWLSAVLRTAVSSVRVEPIGTGQTGATYRLTPVYPCAVDLPSTFVVKLPSQDQNVRERVALGYRAEHIFYRDVAHTVSAPLPFVYYCAIDRDGADFVLLMADLSPANQGDQLAGCTPEQARLGVEALAGLHGPRWCDPAWLDFSGATMPYRLDAEYTHGMSELARAAADITVKRLGGLVSGHDQEILFESADLVGGWLQLEPERFALLHGDYRLDNMLFAPGDARITIIDWQTLAVGLPARDLSYFLGTSLQPDQRAHDERRLVGDYHRKLLAHGVGNYSGSECWRDYRLGMLQIPLLTTLGFAFSAATDRGDDMVATMLHRGCRAIRDLDTAALVRDLSGA